MFADLTTKEINLLSRKMVRAYTETLAAAHKVPESRIDRFERTAEEFDLLDIALWDEARKRSNRGEWQ